MSRERVRFLNEKLNQARATGNRDKARRIRERRNAAKDRMAERGVYMRPRKEPGPELGEAAQQITPRPMGPPDQGRPGGNLSQLAEAAQGIEPRPMAPEEDGAMRPPEPSDYAVKPGMFQPPPVPPTPPRIRPMPGMVPPRTQDVPTQGLFPPPGAAPPQGPIPPAGGAPIPMPKPGSLPPQAGGGMSGGNMGQPPITPQPMGPPGSRPMTPPQGQPVPISPTGPPSPGGFVPPPQPPQAPGARQITPEMRRLMMSLQNRR